MHRYAVHLVLLLMMCLPGSAAVNAQQGRPSGKAAELSARGVEALKAGNLDEAEKAFLEAQRTGGPTALIHHNLGIINQQRGEHEKAVAQLRRALRLEPGRGESHFLLGVSLIALNRPAEAVSSLERAVKLLPKLEQPRLQLARIHERMDNWLGAVDQYQALSELNPREPEYAYHLGRAYSRLSEWGYRRIISIDPDSARLHQALGQHYLTQGKYDLALAEFRRAAEIDPKLPEIHLALAVIHLERRDFDQAMKEIDIELGIVPQSVRAKEVRQRIEEARLR